MSGIYIKSMEMPKRGELSHVRIYDNGEVTIESNGIEYPVAKAVAMPDHGRLIDADAFKKYISVAFEEVAPELSGVYSWLAKQITEDLMKDIDEAPTVIPAEGVE